MISCISYETTIAIFFLFAFFFCSFGQAIAQDNYEIQVYTSDLVETSHTMVELLSNFILNGNPGMNNPGYSSNHVAHESVEVTHGFSNWLEVGSYLFTSIGPVNRTGIAGVHLRPRFTVPESYQLPLGLV